MTKETCSSCEAGIQCVACSMAGRAFPTVKRYVGRKGQTIFTYSKRRKEYPSDDANMQLPDTLDGAHQQMGPGTRWTVPPDPRDRGERIA